MEITLMSPKDWMTFFLSIGAYAPLIVGAIKEKMDKSQVFTTWFLYLLLDAVNMASSSELDGSYVILFGFAVGSFIMSAILLYQGRIGWT
jgi:hypothetical protein